MTTDLNRPVKRRSHETLRDTGKARRVIVTLYPAGHMGLRLEGTRREETLPLTTAYEIAVRARLITQRAEKAKLRKKGK